MNNASDIFKKQGSILDRLDTIKPYSDENASAIFSNQDLIDNSKKESSFSNRKTILDDENNPNNIIPG